MKIKGINPVEQHFEKGVFALVGLLALGAVASQFLLAPNAVEDTPSMTPGGRAQKLSPNNAYQLVAQDANALKAKVTASDPEFEEPELPDLRSRWTEAAATKSAPAQLAYAGPVWKIEVQAGGAGVGEKIAPFAVPAPENVQVAQVTNTLDPNQVESLPELAELAHLTQQPYDATVVSVQGTLNVDALKESLLRPGPDGAPSAPAGWWREGLEVLAVRLERREQVGDAWGEPTLVSSLPGSLDLVEEMRVAPLNFDGMRDILATAAEQSAEIRRAPYLDSIAGPEWAPPSEAGSLDDLAAEQLEMDRQVAQFENQTRRVATLQKQVDDAENETTRTNRQRTLDQEKARLDQTMARMRELGHVFEGDPVETEEEPVLAVDEKARLLDNKSVIVWAHDVTAEPGKTYQYRMSLELNNPAYGRVAVLAEEQRSLAQQLTMRSAPTEWSGPVTIDARRYFFMTGASVGEDLLANESARLDVFEFYYGFWRQGTTAVEPGEIVRAKAPLPDGLEVFLPVAGASRPVTPPPTGEVVQPPRAGFEQAGVLREAQAVGKDRDIVIPVQLLDVSRLVEADSSRDGRGTFADLNGALIKRVTSVDRVNPMIARLEASAKMGMTQGKPRQVENPINQAPVPDPRGTPPAQDPGKGGGGGGGGGG